MCWMTTADSQSRQATTIENFICLGLIMAFQKECDRPVMACQIGNHVTCLTWVGVANAGEVHLLLDLSLVTSLHMCRLKRTDSEAQILGQLSTLSVCNVGPCSRIYEPYIPRMIKCCSFHGEEANAPPMA